MTDRIDSLPCAECGQPVKPEEAFVVDLELQNGTSEVVVFHKGPDFMCPFKWSVRKLQVVGQRLESILALFPPPRNPV
jgi:hypothetical protein